MHGDILLDNGELLSELEELLEIQKKESERILELLASSLGTLGFVRDTI
jgi:U3 small nucleolar RNA-associated protein 21